MNSKEDFYHNIARYDDYIDRKFGSRGDLIKVLAYMPQEWDLVTRESLRVVEVFTNRKDDSR